MNPNGLSTSVVRAKDATIAVGLSTGVVRVKDATIAVGLSTGVVRVKDATIVVFNADDKTLTSTWCPLGTFRSVYLKS
jgi:hypothetical protein